MTQTEEAVRQPERENGKAPRESGTAHGVLITVIVLAIVAAVVIGGIVPRLRAKEALQKETYDLAVPTVNVTHPKQGAPQTEIVLPGNMQAFTESPIYARTSGYLKKWYVDIGGRVKTGQLLAEIETPEVDQQLQQARSQLNTAKANYNLAQITSNRYQELKNTDSVAQQDVDNALGSERANAATVSAAEYQVKYLEQLESFRKIYAPFDGIITVRNTDVGHLINSGAGSVTAELFHIAAIHTLRVYINVPQQFSPAAKTGLSASLTLQEFPGRQFKGRLVRTANAIDLATRTLLVEVDVDNPTGELLPGAYAEVHLAVPSGAPTFILPVSALIFRAQGLQVGVVKDGKRAQLANIILGRDFGSEVEVVSGLQADDQVITNPPDSLISGEEVRVGQPPAQNPQSQRPQSGGHQQ
ncbi:MAG TPA: efflux RND transporter periplasmic adaptor subunit [Candidatus Acidoferrales bacterium]|nr:efflux RND transporter periplasmic adaptor subunit [Candidatus Acidoferrales bacterium]